MLVRVAAAAVRSSHRSRVVEMISSLRVGRLRARFAFEVFDLGCVWSGAARRALLEEVRHVPDLKQQKEQRSEYFT